MSQKFLVQNFISPDIQQASNFLALTAALEGERGEGYQGLIVPVPTQT